MTAAQQRTAPLQARIVDAIRHHFGIREVRPRELASFVPGPNQATVS